MTVSGIHILRLFFKLSNEVESLESLGKVCQIFSPMKEAVSIP